MDLKQQECEKLIGVVPVSTMQITFKKVMLVKFWCSIKEEFPNYLKRLLKYSSPFQLRIFKSEQRKIADWMQKQIGESSYLLLKLDIKRFAKM